MPKNIKYPQSTVIKLLVIVTALITASGFMFGIKTSLSSEWRQRFSDVNQLNRYAETNKIEIKNVNMNDLKVKGAVFSGATFDNTDWESVSFFGANIKNSRFNKGKYRNAAFQKAVIENTTFEGVTFINGDFQGATLRDVQFVNCNFGKANFKYLEDSDVIFKDAVLEEVEFYESKADVQFIDSKLTEVEMMGVQAKEHFIVRGSDVYDVDLNDATIPRLEITDSTIKKAGFSGGKAKSLLMKNLKGAWQASGAKIDDIVVENVEAEVLFLAGVTARSIKVSDVVVTDSFNARAKAAVLEIDDSDIKSIWNDASAVGSYIVRNTKLRGSSSTSSKFELIRFKNVELNGIFNFEGTHADNIELINVTKGPSYEFLGDGGNIHF